jgi:oligopeptide/dipeptide ABC transporter ATP-binding protein
MSTALDVRDLTVRFDTPHGSVRAVSGMSYTLEEGETLGLVGESGSGKSVSSLAVMGLVPSPPGTIEAGRAMLGERDLLKLPDRELRRLRGDEVSMIFQDPMTSLNPFLTVGRQLDEVLEVHRGTTRRAARARCAQALDEVGIPEPDARLDSYPHELSGGMRQRVMIAMALLCEPRVLFADEPTTALDVTIQAQILELMKKLQHDHGTAIVLITHDLGVVAGMSDRVNVMYAGRLVESASSPELFGSPEHPYTRGLIASIPSFDGPLVKKLHAIEGQPPDLARLGDGCAFAPRCELVSDRCRAERPELEGGTRLAACFETSAAEEEAP